MKTSIWYRPSCRRSSSPTFTKGHSKKLWSEILSRITVTIPPLCIGEVIHREKGSDWDAHYQRRQSHNSFKLLLLTPGSHFEEALPNPKLPFSSHQRKWLQVIAAGVKRRSTQCITQCLTCQLHGISMLSSPGRSFKQIHFSDNVLFQALEGEGEVLGHLLAPILRCSATILPGKLANARPYKDGRWPLGCKNMMHQKLSFTCCLAGSTSMLCLWMLHWISVYHGIAWAGG